MKFIVAVSTVAALAVVASTGCSKRNVDTLEAVKQGVIKDIPKDINVSAMDVNVVSVSFRDSEADAVVSFAAKGGPPMMTMNYTMERKGGEWHIKKRAAGDLQKHAAQAPAPAAPSGGGMNLPEGHPPMGESGMGARGMGAGSAAGRQLPAGHPALPGKAADGSK